MQAEIKEYYTYFIRFCISFYAFLCLKISHNWIKIRGQLIIIPRMHLLHFASPLA